VESDAATRYYAPNCFYNTICNIKDTTQETERTGEFQPEITEVHAFPLTPINKPGMQFQCLGLVQGKQLQLATLQSKHYQL